MTSGRTAHLLGMCLACVLMTNVLLTMRGAESTVQTPASGALERDSEAAKAPVDRLIPWLLEEDRQLRAVPFSEVIFDTTGKNVIAFNPNDQVDRAVVNAIGSVL